MRDHIEHTARYWAQSPAFDPKTRQEIQSLLDHPGGTEELTDRFYRDLEFGTGGLRGILGAGTNRMNLPNIRRATKALCLYLKEIDPENLSLGITYDSRRDSRAFAWEAACVAAFFGFKVFITKDMGSTPFLSFMVRHLRCTGGINITASHNPPEYNGYKVYWSTGGQLVPPHDQGIIERYKKEGDYGELPKMPQKDALARGLIIPVGEEMTIQYFLRLREEFSFYTKPIQNLPIVYTPLGGVGFYVVPRALGLFGFNRVTTVEEDSVLDGSFRGIPSANPEDPKAYQNAIRLAEKIGARLILATDPDGDRFGLMTFENGAWQWFTGHQLGALLTDFLLGRLKARDALPPGSLVIKTVVTGDLMARVAQSYGVKCEETLTGFKWICDRIETTKDHFICGTEESYGFMAGRTLVRDKDGILACSLAAQMVAFYQDQNKTLVGVLEDLYEKHGFFEEDLKNFSFPGQKGSEKMADFMAQLESNPFVDPLPQDPVVQAVDYRRGLILSRDGTRAPTGLPQSPGIQLRLKSGSRVSLRPSGTEPKLKLYLSMTTTRDQRQEAKTQIQTVVDFFSERL
jgi:phosphoglucomutase